MPDGVKMNVAIIGGGLAGLSCAYELQKNGITAEIFEKTAVVGENFELPVILLKMFNTAVNDPLKYLNKKFKLNLTPTYNVNELILSSPGKTITINENVGSIFRRGSFKGSMNDQIRSVVTAPININTPIDFKAIKNKFDHVVIASGSLSEAEQMNILTPSYNAMVRLATVNGQFRTDSVKVWFNTVFARQSYAYLIPDTDKQAKLVLVVDNITAAETNEYWDKFLSIANINYQINRTIDISHKIGSVNPVQLGNLYFVGLAGGFIDDVIGIGSPYAVLSGLLAGKCIVNNLDFNKAAQFLINDVKRKHILRETMNRFENADFDKLVTFMDTPFAKAMMFKNPFYKITQNIPLARGYNIVKKEIGY